MRIGLQISQYKFPGGPSAIRAKLKTIAQAAEAAGFDSLWVMDHFFQLDPMIGSADDPMLEAYTTLGYLAGVTENVTLGTLVTGVIYREPALLIKAVTTLDDLSGGRAYLGIGAGWYEREAIGLGFNNPLTSERFERLEETLQLAKQMWAGDRQPFMSKHYKLHEPICSPLPLQKPHPKILIGGGGEQKTLKMVAKYGDACNVFGYGGANEVSQKFDVLRKHCESVGRDYTEIEKTVLGGGSIGRAAGSPDRTLSYAKELAAVGVQHLMYSADPGADPDAYDKFAKLANEIHQL